MARAKIAAIDIGTTKVCTIMGDIDKDGIPRSLGVGIAPSRGLEKGVVVNMKETKEAVRESIKKAEQSAGYRLKSAYVGVTGRNISSVNSRGTIAITHSDQRVHARDLQRVLKVACNIKVPEGQKPLHVIPRTYIIDGQDMVKNPVGMYCFRLDLEAHLITAAAASTENLVKCIRGVGIGINDLIMEPLASAEAVLTEEERQNGVLVADIGGEATDIAVYMNNTIYYTSVLHIGGCSITRDICAGLGLPFDIAEEMKKKYGNVTPIHDRAGEVDKVLTEKGQSVSCFDLREITRIRVDELLRLILLELPRTDYPKFIQSGLVLTGGTADLVGIAELGCEITRLPVRVGKPISLAGISDTLRDPAFATSVGLLLWKTRNKEIQRWQPRGRFRRFIPLG